MRVTKPFVYFFCSLIPTVTPKLDGRTKAAKALAAAAAAAASSSTTTAPAHAAISKLLLVHQAADRKSPRCHASTKSLISSNSANPASSSVQDGGGFEFVDECSNDSTYGE